MIESRETKIELLAGDGEIKKLQEILKQGYNQYDLDIALENAIAYSQIETAEYLIGLGADISHYDYQGVYYAVHNNEIEGLKFSIAKGVDINICDGLLINTAIITCVNEHKTELLEWMFENGAEPKLLSKHHYKLFKTLEITNSKN